MDKSIDKFVPVLFQKLSTYEGEDTRFLKVKIWLMHIGENLNGSYFDKNIVEEAIPTLANTPILAYIEDNSEGDTDFSDHRMKLEKVDGQYKFKYLGQVVGVIPESNNAQFEKRVCDDGIEREFLTVDGLVFTKLEDSTDIFNRDVIKSQSMELHDNYEGDWGDDGLFHFSKFTFYGACALGEDVLPAMRSSTIEVQFTQKDIFEEIQQKMEQFKRLFCDNEGGSVEVDEKLELLGKYSLTVEELKEKNINIEEYTLEALEETLKELTSPPSSEFSLTGQQFVDELSKETVKDDRDWEYAKYSYVDYKDNEVYAYDREDNYKLVGFTFEAKEDSIVIDFASKKRKKFEVVDFVEGTDVDFTAIPKEILEYEIKVAEKKISDTFTQDKEEMESKFNKLEEEITSLREFKATKLTEERVQQEQELFEKFSSELTEQEINELKEVVSDFTLEQLEEKLFTLVGKKKFSVNSATKKEKHSNVKIDIETPEDKPASAYGDLFEKYKSN